jgi:ribosome-associated toxin RatA of RatAB toxin-antitoxin module
MAPRLLLAFLSVFAAAFVLAAAPVSVTVNESDGAWHVDGIFLVEAAPEIAWQVLTDYDHLPAFVSSLEESRVVGRPGAGAVLVEQTATDKTFFFAPRMRVTLLIHEYEHAAIVFSDTLHADFVSNEGSWTIRQDERGCRVDYHMIALPRFSVPKFLLAPAFAADAHALLGEVRAEMQRRASASTATPP